MSYYLFLWVVLFKKKFKMDISEATAMVKIILVVAIVIRVLCFLLFRI